MAETSNTTTDHQTVAAELRVVADTIAALPITEPARSEITWFADDDETLRTIMAAFPGAGWRPYRGTGGSMVEWIAGRVGSIKLAAFAADPESEPPSRVSALFDAEQVSS